MNPTIGARCSLCSSPLDTKAPGVYQRVTGWVPVHGSGAVRLPSHPLGYAHRHCLDSAAKGGDPTQQVRSPRLL